MASGVWPKTAVGPAKPAQPGVGIVLDSITLVDIVLACHLELGGAELPRETVLFDSAVLDPAQCQIAERPSFNAAVRSRPVTAEVLIFPKIGGSHVRDVVNLIPVSVKLGSMFIPRMNNPLSLEYVRHSSRISALVLD